MSTTPTKGVPPYWDAAKVHLCRQDPILARVIQRLEDPPLKSSGRPFETLVHSIVGQQISAKAAAAIWGRFRGLVTDVSPEEIGPLAPQALREVGLSGRKAEYILGLANDAAWIGDHPWHEYTDDQVRKQLCALRGVGPWTAEMVLIFSLLRPDILPLGDIGVVRAIERLYAKGERLSKEQLLSFAAPWAPYRTAASWYLWRCIDDEPVEY